MTREETLAAALKLLFALPVLRWPLAGAILSILADGLDVVVMNYVDLGGGGIRDYHLFDKWTDLFGLVTFFLVSLRWEGRDRAIAVVLFALRIAGIAAFEILGLRSALAFLPNLFETWFLYVLIREAWVPKDAPGLRAALLTGLVAFKLAQEWVLHVTQILDRYNLSEVLDRLRGH